jgi:hypothetical protein
LLGDYNQDGTVDAADYVVWRSTIGQTGSNLAADGDANGVVDYGDYSVWRANFGSTSPAASPAIASGFAVPEPATGTPCVVAILSILLWNARRRRNNSA